MNMYNQFTHSCMSPPTPPGWGNSNHPTLIFTLTFMLYLSSSICIFLVHFEGGKGEVSNPNCGQIKLKKKCIKLWSLPLTPMILTVKILFM